MFLRTVATASALVRYFGKQTRKSTIPRILKDPNYTQTGFRNSGPQRRQYNLEGVTNAHLYYDKKEDSKIDRKRRRVLEVARRREPPIDDQSIEAIIEDLTNHDLVLRGNHLLTLRLRQDLPAHRPTRETAPRQAPGIQRTDRLPPQQASKEPRPKVQQKRTRHSVRCLESNPGWCT